MMIIFRVVIHCFFLCYQILNPVYDAVDLYLTSIICEIWFAILWILDQFPKWFPINRETYLDHHSLRFEREGESSLLAPVDLFVSTIDPLKEPPLLTSNIVLSILAVDYPVDKVPFCKEFAIDPRPPEYYFTLKMDYLKDKVQPTFVKERRAMKREYEEFKVRINDLVVKSLKAPTEGWIMQDGTPWPGNNAHDHLGIIHVFLGQSGSHDTEGNKFPASSMSPERSGQTSSTTRKQAP